MADDALANSSNIIRGARRVHELIELEGSISISIDSIDDKPVDLESLHLLSNLGSRKSSLLD